MWLAGIVFSYSVSEMDLWPASCPLVERSFSFCPATSNWGMGVRYARCFHMWNSRIRMWNSRTEPIQDVSTCGILEAIYSRICDAKYLYPIFSCDLARGFAIQGCTGSRTHSNAPLAGLRYTRLYWFEDAFQRPARGASLYKAVLVRGRIPTRGFAIQGCTGSRTHSNAPFAGLRYTRLYWFEDAFQRPARGASLYKAVLVRGRIPTPRSRWKSSAISRKKPHKSGWVGNPGSYMWLVWVVVLSSVLAGDISYSWLYSTSNRES